MLGFLFKFKKKMFLSTITAVNFTTEQQKFFLVTDYSNPSENLKRKSFFY